MALWSGKGGVKSEKGPEEKRRKGFLTGEASARRTGMKVVSTKRPERFKEKGRNAVELRPFLNLGAEEGIHPIAKR